MYKPIKRTTESDSVFAYFVLSSHADGFVIFLRYALLHYLNEWFNTGLKHHVGVEEERAEERLRVTGQLEHNTRQQNVHI